MSPEMGVLELSREGKRASIGCCLLPRARGRKAFSYFPNCFYSISWLWIACTGSISVFSRPGRGVFEALSCLDAPGQEVLSRPIHVSDTVGLLLRTLMNKSPNDC